jgi:pyruvate kinase
MTYNPRPTRAEVSDVANAVLDGADCVMLSGETAKGAYPVEAVDMMHRLCREAESIIFYLPLFNELRAITPKPTSATEAIASSAVNASLEQDAAAIIVLTTTGNTARLCAKYRPRVPIITVTRYQQIARQCHLYRGCYPYHYERPPKAGTESNEPASESPRSPYMAMETWQEDVDTRFYWAIDLAKKEGMLKVGDTVVGIQGWKGGAGNSSVMRILTVPDVAPVQI